MKNLVNIAIIGLGQIGIYLYNELRSKKKEIERKYNNVKCILSSSNVGMGAGNNLGIKNVSNDYVFILNPDVVLQNDTIDEIIKDVKSIDSFGLVAPISDKIEYPNYKLDKNKNQSFDPINPFKVKETHHLYPF